MVSINSNQPKIVIDPFCFRQFDQQNNSSTCINYQKEKFVEEINKLYDPTLLKAGYADFCKLLFVENFTDAQESVVEITSENEKYIKSGYERRNEKELPVLKRFIQKENIQLQKAKYLNIILYSKAQVQKENLSMGNTDPNANIDYDYGIVSVKPQNQDSEISMDPITMMRNALGMDQGGSGVPLDREKYLKSVEFWEKHVIVK